MEIKQSNPIKEAVQYKALGVWYNAGRNGTIAAGTGFGKSRLAVIEIAHLLKMIGLDKDDILIVSPTTKLRDVNWPNEFEDWGEGELYRSVVKSICYASLKKEYELLQETGKRYKLIVLDEIHRLTELSANAFRDGEEEFMTRFVTEGLTDAVMGLTATAPDPKRDPDKANLLEQIAPIVFRYSLDDGVKDGLIADYEIRVIMCPPEANKRTIDAGSKKKQFKVTEQKQYDYMTTLMQNTAIEIDKVKRSFSDGSLDLFADIEAAQKAKDKLTKLSKQMERYVFARTRFIYGLESKTNLAVRCIDALRQQGVRFLVFCGGIAQADKLLGKNVYHSKSDNTAFQAFNNKEINELGVVNAANEGINFVDLDQILVIQVDSNARNLIQRIGRALRIRPGHIGVVYILCASNTVDQQWLEVNLRMFDQSKIKFFTATDIE